MSDFTEAVYSQAFRSGWLAALRHARTSPTIASPIEQAFWDEWCYVFPNVQLVPQHRIGQYKVDFAFPATKTAIELDGFSSHSSTDDIARDRKRQREIEAQGWHMIRFGGKEIHQDVHACVIEVGRILAMRSANAPPPPHPVKLEPKLPRQFFTCVDCCTRYSVRDIALVSQCDLCDEYICSSCYSEKDGILSCTYCSHHHALCATCGDMLSPIDDEYGDWRGPVCSSCFEPLCDTCSKGFGMCITCIRNKFTPSDEELDRKEIYIDEHLNESSLMEVKPEARHCLPCPAHNISSDIGKIIIRDPVIQDVIKTFTATIADVRAVQHSENGR